MNATHLRNIFMPPEGVEMTGNDPHHPEMHIDRRAFRDDSDRENAEIDAGLKTPALHLHLRLGLAQ